MDDTNAIEVQNKEDENIYLDVKHKQLLLPFDDMFASGPWDLNSKFEELNKVFIPLELAKHPFFLCGNTKKVKDSRKGYFASKKLKSLRKKKLSEEELREKTKYETSPVDTQQIIREITPYKQDDTLMNKVDEWQIQAHQNYGFPDEFDGLVWDYILSLVADINKKTGNFYQLYFFTPADIINDLVNKGIYLNQFGWLNAQIHDSLMRLKATIFSSEKGLIRKDTREVLSKNEYQFSLLSSVYFKGDTLPKTKKKLTRIAVAIDPVILLNFRSNHFLIGFHPQRRKLLNYPSKSLFDRLSFLVYNSIASDDSLICLYSNVKPFVFMKYQNLCDFLGYIPKTKKEYTPNKIFRQFNIIFNELITNKVIENVFLDIFKNESGVRSFNFIFIIANDFLNNVLTLSSKEMQKRVSNGYSIKECQEYFKKISGIIRNEEIRKYLIRKTNEGNEVLPDGNGFPSFITKKN